MQFYVVNGLFKKLKDNPKSVIGLTPFKKILKEMLTELGVAFADPCCASPIANAGPDQSLVSGTTTATLTSAASTAGSGTITSRLWSKVSGPGTQVITTPTTTSTTVTGLQAGTFVFNVTITNNSGNTSTDSVTIIVAA